jgi:intracellular sulfur oxidation DsrE/DsrF family protein
MVIAISLFSSICTVSAKENEAIEGVRSAKAIFDFRIGEPKSAAVHMDVIYQTYKDLATMKKKPVFVVVFMGPSVKLLSQNNAEFSSELAEKISAMAKDGIKFEICMVAVNLLNVDSMSILREIKKVDNGWISEIGYQYKGYALVPVY